MPHSIRSATIVAAMFWAFTGALAQAGNQSRAHAFPVANGLFEVVGDFSENDIYWCGAANFAQANLSAAGTDRMYIWRGPGPSTAQPGDKSVQFGMTAQNGDMPAHGLTYDVDAVGASLSVAQAWQSCLNRTTSG